MDYEIKYSDRRTITLSVKNGKLIVRAPFGTSRAVVEKLVSEHIDWVEKHIARQRERNSRLSELTPEKIAELRALAKTILPEKTAHFAEIMGVKYGRITITGAKTRFGSCTSRGNISFSYRIMQYPEEAIDYVVVHELAHLIELNHSERFYRIVASIMPDYKQRQKILKK